jgi:hypothetical protein
VHRRLTHFRLQAVRDAQSHILASDETACVFGERE